MDSSKKYFLVDSGNGWKLENFGRWRICRPASVAIWPIAHPEEWKKVDGRFSREGGNSWTFLSKLPDYWEVEHEGVLMKIAPTPFGHMGFFPEHGLFWPWIRKKSQNSQKKVKLLNLFAYSGGATIAAAQGGAEVCHVDGSQPILSLARENASLNGLEGAPIRWIGDDVKKFVKREIRRKLFYDAIIIDPPSFGRGGKGEVFTIEKELFSLLSLCRCLLTEKPLFVLLTCHTPAFSPLVLKNLLQCALLPSKYKGEIEGGELCLFSEKSPPLPNGSFARWIGANEKN